MPATNKVDLCFLCSLSFWDFVAGIYTSLFTYWKKKKKKKAALTCLWHLEMKAFCASSDQAWSLQWTSLLNSHLNPAGTVSSDSTSPCGRHISTHSLPAAFPGLGGQIKLLLLGQVWDLQHVLMAWQKARATRCVWHYYLDTQGLDSDFTEAPRLCNAIWDELPGLVQLKAIRSVALVWIYLLSLILGLCYPLNFHLLVCLSQQGHTSIL